VEKGSVARGRSCGEAEEAQRTTRRLARIELAQRAGRRVARIREDGFTSFRALAVELLELVEREIALAANLEQPRRVRIVEAERNIAHGAQIRGYDLADDAVAARGARHQHAVLVGEAHRGAIDLELLGVRALRILADEPGEARLPLAQLVVVERVPQRDHGEEVSVLGELTLRRSANALRGRVERAELGVLLLEVAQLAIHAIVLEIGDLRTVEHVVLVRRALERAPKLGGARGEFVEARGHQ